MGMHSVVTLLGLTFAAGVAGWVDAIVGGGGLIQTPAFMLAFPAASPATIVGTTKIPSAVGAIMSGRRYFRQPQVNVKQLWLLFAVGCTFGAMGAAVTSLLSDAVFRPIVLAALIIVLIVMIVRPSMGVDDHDRDAPAKIAGNRRSMSGIAAFFGFYDGAIGSGTGTFLTLSFAAKTRLSFLRIAPYVKAANIGSNLGSLALLIVHGGIFWIAGLLMAAAGAGGAHLGSGFALKHGSRAIRYLLIVVAAAMIVRLGYSIV